MYLLFAAAASALVIALVLLFSTFNPFERQHPSTLEALALVAPEQPKPSPKPSPEPHQVQAWTAYQEALNAYKRPSESGSNGRSLIVDGSYGRVVIRQRYTAEMLDAFGHVESLITNQPSPIAALTALYLDLPAHLGKQSTHVIALRHQAAFNDLAAAGVL